MKVGDPVRFRNENEGYYVGVVLAFSPCGSRVLVKPRGHRRGEWFPVAHVKLWLSRVRR